MIPAWRGLLFAIVMGCNIAACAEDWNGRVKKTVEHCTLDQQGTKAFHLKAVLAPSFERDKDSGRNGTVEIWWASPTRWKREVRSTQFHQIEIVDGSHDWQKNEGDYFPEWLRETAMELVRPVPPLQDVLDHVKSAEVRNLFGRQINIDWITNTGTPEVHNIKRSGIALDSSSGRLLYAFGFGWGGEFKDYSDFHGRTVAHTVNVGSPQVTAKIVLLEDLGEVQASLWNAEVKDGDPQPLTTVLLDEVSLRKNLLSDLPSAWPPLKDGPLQGNITTDVIVDRTGKIRELGVLISENPQILDGGRERILAMQFKPFVQDGIPVQVMSQMTIPFKTVRPAGEETFESARSYFERGRRASFPAAGTTPYTLRAEFEIGTATGPAKGRYEDTWMSNTQWRREAWLGDSHYGRSRDGEKTFEESEGSQAAVLKFLLTILEPIPALDSFHEADWRIKRETINGIPSIRVLAGYESPDGKLDPEQARGYWFDDSGLLLKTFFTRVESQRSDFQDFVGIRIARRVDVLKDARPAIRVSVTAILSPDPPSAGAFQLKGESHRAFTSEVR